MSFAAAIVLLIVGSCLLTLQMPRDKRLHNYRLSRRLMGWAYILLAVAGLFDVTAIDVDQDFTLVVVLILAGCQALLFSFALATLVNPIVASLCKITDYVLFIGMLSVLLVAVLFFAPALFRPVFYGCLAFYCVELGLFVRLFVKEWRRCKTKLDNFFSDNEERRLWWVAVAFLLATCVGIMVVVLLLYFNLRLLLFFVVFYLLCYIYLGMRYISYPTEFYRIAPAVDPEQEPATGASAEAIGAALERWLAGKGYLQAGLSLDALAREIGCNRSYLSRHVNSELGLNFKAWIRSLRIAESQKLLRDHAEIPVTEIGEMVGIHGRSTFFAQFLETTGMSPGEYRRHLDDASR